MGSKFCTSCGKPLAPGGRKSPGARGARKAKSAATGGSGTPSGDATPAGNATLAWWVAGALLVVALVALGYPVLSRNTTSPTGTGGGAPPGMGGAGGGASAVDLTTMSLEEQGTILFNRVMRSSSGGDQADVDFFLPKALIIYEEINPTDPDGLYHYALLYMVGEDYAAALEKAREGLAQVPDYVLLLGVGAEAAAAMGDSTTARDMYTHLLDVYDTELGMTRAGYEHHQPMFQAYKSAAEAFLSEGQGGE